MLSVFGGGFDAPQTPTMTRGDEDSVEESKALDPSLVDTGDSGRNNPHGEMGSGGVVQAIAQIQCDDDDTQDWDAKVLSHALVHILDKDKLDTDATNKFTVFVIGEGIDDAHLLLTVLEDDFKSMRNHIEFKTFQSPPALNSTCDKQVSDSMSNDNENMWFLGLSKHTLMQNMMGDTKVNTVPSTAIASAPGVPLGRLNSDKAKLETAWQLSLAMFNVGKPLLAPTPTAGNVC